MKVIITLILYVPVFCFGQSQYNKPSNREDTIRIIKTTVEKFRQEVIDTTGFLPKLSLNNFIFDYIFEYSDDLETLKKAENWMEMLVRSTPDYPVFMDTYANIMYKSGQKEKAIQWEEKAVQINKGASAKNNRPPDPALAETLEKMKKGIPTWNIGNK